MNAIKQEECIMEKQISNQLYSSDLLTKLRQQQDAGALCSLNLKVEDQTFKVHKCVFAANSAALNSMLSSLTDDSSYLVLSNVTVEEFKPLLTYMYSGKLDFSDVSPEGFMLAAQRLQMVEAQTLCKEYIDKTSNTESGAEALGNNDDALNSGNQTVDINVSIVSAESTERQSHVEKTTCNSVSEPVNCEAKQSVKKRDTCPTSLSVGDRVSVISIEKALERKSRESGQFQSESTNSEVKESTRNIEASRIAQTTPDRQRMVTRGVKLKFASSKRGKNQDDSMSVKSDSCHLDEKRGKSGPVKPDPDKMVTRRSSKKGKGGYCESQKGKTKTVNTAPRNKNKRSISDEYIYEFPHKRAKRDQPKKTMETEVGKEIKVKKKVIKQKSETSPRKATRDPADKSIKKEEKCNTSVKSVRNKKRSVHSGASQRVKCENCGERYERKADPKSGDDIVVHECQLYKCEECGKIHTSRRLLMKHISYHKEKSCGKFVCDFCGAEYSTKNGLKAHRRKHTGEKPYKCEQCEKCFHILSSLIVHRKSHDDQKNLICEKCGQAFKHKNSLRAHRHKHETEKDHTCKDCQESFISKEDLDRHKQVCLSQDKGKKTGSSPSKAKKMKKYSSKKLKYSSRDKSTNVNSTRFPVLLKCKSCHKRFVHKQVLFRHIVSAHREHAKVKIESHGSPKPKNTLKSHRKKPNSVKNYSVQNMQKVFCTICKQFFISKEMLEKHKRNKHNFYRYSYLDCRKLFASYHSLTRHRRLHKRSVICRTCDQKFSSVALMRNQSLERQGDKSHDSMFSCERCRRQFFLKSLLLNHSCSVGLKCKRCDRYFHTYGFYKKHMMRHIPNSYCDICDKFFESASALACHRDAHGLSFSCFVCPFCNWKFEQKMDLISHLKDHEGAEINLDTDGSEVYRCSVCKKLIKGFSSFKQHILSHTKTWPCEHCGKVFINCTKFNLKRHINSVHKGLKPFQCLTCQKSFVDKASLRDHMNVHTKKNPYKCKICEGSITFRTRQMLGRHVLSKHGMKGYSLPKTNKQIKLKPYECKFCREVFVKKYAWFKHIRTVHDEGTFTCEKCHKMFTSRQKFTRHMDYHESQSERYVCDVCGKVYKVKCGLTNHMRKHTGEKPYECEYCQRRFALRYSLNVHRKTHTDKRVEICEICGKAYRYCSNLIAHACKHATPKEHTCTICDKSFNFSGDLQTHIAKHTDDMPHRCSVCHKTFKVRSNLDRHIKTHDQSQHGQVIRCETCRQMFVCQEELNEHVKDKHVHDNKISELMEQADRETHITATEQEHNKQSEDYNDYSAENSESVQTVEADGNPTIAIKFDNQGVEIMEEEAVMVKEICEFDHIDATTHGILHIVQDSGEQINIINQEAGVQYVFVQYDVDETLEAVDSLNS